MRLLSRCSCAGSEMKHAGLFKLVGMMKASLLQIITGEGGEVITK